MHPALATLPAWAMPYMGAGKPGRGIIHGLPESEYHGAKALISKSSLDLFGDKSPFHYLAALDAPLEDGNAAPLRIGAAYHIGVLQPDMFASQVLRMPDFGPMQSSTNRRIRDEWIATEAVGKTYLTRSEWEQVNAMRDVLLTSRLGRKLLSPGGEAEVTALWTCPETGMRCKSRADWLHADRGIFVDLKSALSAKPDDFMRAVAAHRYHVQDAMYSRAFDENDVPIQEFVFLVQEKAPPYAYACYRLTVNAKLRGEELYMRELRQLRECIDNDYFPCYSPTDEVMPLDLPGYAARDWETSE